MAAQSFWLKTELPDELINMIDKSLAENYDSQLSDSLTSGGRHNKIRNSKNAWVPTSNWISSFIWERVQRANRENFMYDIEHIDDESMQYTHYGKGEHYGWHTDASITQMIGGVGKSKSSGNNDQSTMEYIIPKVQYVRKLSFSLMLSNPEEYEGGNLEFLDEAFNRYIAPRERGTLVIFDSRAYHRVNKVESGLRKTLVGWAIGPRWK